MGLEVRYTAYSLLPWTAYGAFARRNTDESQLTLLIAGLVYHFFCFAICLTTMLFALIALTLPGAALILTYVFSFRKSAANPSREQPSGVASRKKNNPFSNKGQQQHLEMSHVPDRQDVLVSDSRHLLNDFVPTRRDPHRTSMDPGAYFNPMEVQQWAANSATGPTGLGDEYYSPQSGASLGDDTSLNTSAAGPLLPGSLSTSSSVVSHVSLQYAHGISDPDGLGLTFDPCTASAGYCHSGPETCLGTSNGTNFHSSVSHTGMYYGDDQPYPTPASADIMYSCSSGFASDIPRNYEESSFPNDWAFVQGERVPVWSGQFSPHAMPMSPVSPRIMEASTSSHGSFHAAHTSSPRSSATLEDNEDCGFIPHFSNGDGVHFASSTEAMNRQLDLTRLVRCDDRSSAHDLITP